MGIDQDAEGTDAVESRWRHYIAWVLLSLVIALAGTAPFWANSVLASWW